MTPYKLLLSECDNDVGVSVNPLVTLRHDDFLLMTMLLY